MKKLLVLLTLAWLAPHALASAPPGILSYGPPSQAIPTLSDPMLIGLGLLLFAVAFRAMQTRLSGTPLSIVLALVTAALIAGAGSQLVATAYAVSAPEELANPGGGEAPIYNYVFNSYKNTSGVDQSLGIDPPEFCDNFPGNPNEVSGTQCSDGLILPDEAECFIDCGSALISDARLKRNITRLATLDNGTTLYSFQYLWSEETYVGVMAQDLLGDSGLRKSVVLLPNNYYGVNYRMLGLQMITFDQWQQSARNIYSSGS